MIMPLESGILGSYISSYLFFWKMIFDFEVRGKDTIFSRSFIPIYNLMSNEKINYETEFQKKLKINRGYQEGTLDYKVLNQLNS